MAPARPDTGRGEAAPGHPAGTRSRRPRSLRGPWPPGYLFGRAPAEPDRARPDLAGRVRLGPGFSASSSPTGTDSARPSIDPALAPERPHASDGGGHAGREREGSAPAFQ